MDPRMLLQILPDEDGLRANDSAKISADSSSILSMASFVRTRENDYPPKRTRTPNGWFNLRRHGAPEKQFKEAALSASDFPLLLADVLDRQVMAKYEVEPNPFEPLGRKRMIGDLTRYVKTFAYIGELEMLEIVAPEGPYTQARPMSEGVNQYRLDKWGKRFNLQWECSWPTTWG